MVEPLLFAAAAAVSSAVVLLVWTLMGGRSTTRNVIAHNLQRGDVTDLRTLTLHAPARDRAVQPLIASVARLARRIAPGGTLAGLERKLMLAGRPASWPMERVLAAKVLLGGLGVVVTVSRVLTGASLGLTILLVLFTVLLYVTPDVLLSGRATARQREIVLAMPDTLDQMTICMEAGLGFEAAMARAAHSGEGPLADELVRTLQEIQIGVGRQHALRALAERTGVPDTRHFVTAILQAESYGVPITRVLRNQATELRRKRRQRAEEAARKLPLKLLFPLILFVLPPLFIILIGPAAFQLFDSFAQLN